MKRSLLSTKGITITLLLVGVIIVFSSFVSSVEAEVGSVHGRVYMEYDGEEILLPGVRIRRTDGNTMRSLIFYMTDGVVTRTQDIYRTCKEHVEWSQEEGYKYEVFKYNCVRDIPQRYLDPENRPNHIEYDSNDCREMCVHNECLYEAEKVCDKNGCDWVKSPGSSFWACDHTGTKINPTCAQKCFEFRSHCENFVMPYTSHPRDRIKDLAPLEPGSATWETMIDEIEADVCRGGTTRNEQDANGVETTSSNTLISGSNWHMTHSYYPQDPTNPRINNPGPKQPVTTYNQFKSALCPDGPLGAVTLSGKTADQLNYCGFNCIENPHRLAAYFTNETFNFLESKYGLIPLDKNDSKDGGGSWALRSDGQYDFMYHEKNPTIPETVTDEFARYPTKSISYGDSHGTVQWGNYSPGEYYEVFIGNYMDWFGFDFKWIPPSIPNNPEIIEIPKEDTPWIGTARDDDNAPDNQDPLSMCEDNNPHSFEMTVRDQDGASDIDFVEFNLAAPVQLGSGAQRNWPLRMLFAREFEVNGTSYADNTFMVRDKEVTNVTNPRCYDRNGNLASSPTLSNLNCFKADIHTFKKAQRSVTSINGESVEIFVLMEDITVSNDGYPITLKGAPDGLWSNSTYVAFEIDGDKAYAQFKVQFDGEESANWNGFYHQLWRVGDLAGREDQTADLAGEQLHIFGSDYFHRLAKTQIDLKPPKVTLQKPTTAANNHILMEWRATDDGGSNLMTIWGEAVHTGGPGIGTLNDLSAATRGDSDVSANYRPWSSISGGDFENSQFKAPHLWKISGINTNSYPSSGTEREEIDMDGIKDGTLTIKAKASDQACNVSVDDSPSQTTHVSYLPWLMTRGGLIYSGDSYNIKVQALAGNLNLCPDTQQACNSFSGNSPFDIKRSDVALSSELLSSGAEINNESKVNIDVVKSFLSRNYNDENNKGWFEIFKKNAKDNVTTFPDRFSFEPLVFSALTTLDVECDNGDAPCLIFAQNDITIDSTYTCNKRAMIVVHGNLIIKAPIRSSGSVNGCIFLVRDNVVIEPFNTAPSSDLYPEYDELEAFIIADKNITINRSSQDYGLLIRGSLIGMGDGVSLGLNRGIKNDFNRSSPSLFVHHDLRYLNIADELLFDDNVTSEQEVGIKP